MIMNGSSTATQQKDWIRELATMITCIREDVTPIVAQGTPAPGIENALYRVIK
jgi:hypothetical protein